MSSHNTSTSGRSTRAATMCSVAMKPGPKYGEVRRHLDAVRIAQVDHAQRLADAADLRDARLRDVDRAGLDQGLESEHAADILARRDRNAALAHLGQPMAILGWPDRLFEPHQAVAGERIGHVARDRNRPGAIDVEHDARLRRARRVLGGQRVLARVSLGWLAPADKKMMAGYGSFEEAIDALELAITPGPYICGEQFTAADLYVGAQIGWGMMFGSIEKRPAFDDYFGRLQARPAAIRAREIDDALIAAQKAARRHDRHPIERAAIALYDRFTHEGMDRRAFMAELTRIAGGAAAASALLSSIACQAAAAPQVAAGRCRGSRVRDDRMGAAPRPPLSRLQCRAGRGRRRSADGPRHPRESRPQRPYPRRRPPRSPWPAIRRWRPTC